MVIEDVFHLLSNYLTKLANQRTATANTSISQPMRTSFSFWISRHKKTLAFKASVLLFCISNNFLTLLNKSSLSLPSKYMKYMKNSVKNLHDDYHVPLHRRWEKLFLLKSTTERHYLQITISMIKSVSFLTILIHISAGYLLISSFKHLKDERNIVNSTVPWYLYFLKFSCLLLLF